MPQCSRCASKGFLCKVAPESSRYAECVRSTSKCDCRGPTEAALLKLESEEKKLEDAIRETDSQTEALHQEVEQLHSRLREQYGRASRLRRQQKVLKERGSEMLRRGIQSLDELDGVAPAGPVSPEVVPSPSGELFRELSPGFWEALPDLSGFALSGGTAAVSSGSSQGAS